MPMTAEQEWPALLIPQTSQPNNIFNKNLPNTIFQFSSPYCKA
jgi:hypothetical protein